eukprot:TRINITY_DN96184_c0_g1_i1.p1 TRINITY_DN96184_c0_g1~~TRINITY_DN96184_c0_g1_i1.p1  ORF type:complete len:136 (+),score=23.86 TRINITY_DN96184_c0_g1_i1:54-461(+)
MDHALAVYERAFRIDDHHAMLSLMTEDVVFSDPLSGEIRSKEALRKHLAQASGVMKDVAQVIEVKVIQGSEVFLKWVHTGTNAVTRKEYSFAGCTFCRFRGEQVAEHHDYFDPRALIAQFKDAYRTNRAAGKSKL